MADKVKRFKQPEMSEFERLAEICTISGYYCLEEVRCTSAARREPLQKSLSTERPVWARIFRKNPDSKAPPVETVARPAPFKKGDIYTTLLGIDALGGIGGILRLHQESVNMFPAAPHGGNKAEPPPHCFLGAQA